MAKKILIVPSNAISRTANRTPYIVFENTGFVQLTVTPTAKIKFSGNTVGDTNLLTVDPANGQITANSIFVTDYFAVGGIQVINSSGDWIGPTTGLLGAQGAPGNTGYIGNPGNTGYPGAQGSVGSKGAQGNIGNPGTVGPTGDKGNNGGTGNTGAQGAVGPTGDKGTLGGIGNTGAQGAVGPTGDKGNTGGTGNTGEIGRAHV